MANGKRKWDENNPPTDPDELLRFKQAIKMRKFRSDNREHCLRVRRQWLNDNRGRHNASQRAWRRKNPEAARMCTKRAWERSSREQKDEWNRRTREKWKNNPDLLSVRNSKAYMARRDKKLKLRLHQSDEDICVTCFKTAEEAGKAMAVDHCHVTDLVRAVLCPDQGCNTALGGLGEKVENALRLAVYIDWCNKLRAWHAAGQQGPRPVLRTDLYQKVIDAVLLILKE